VDLFYEITLHRRISDAYPKVMAIVAWCHAAAHDGL